MTSATCPGARTLLPGTDAEYLRVAFWVTWIDNSHSLEILYLTEHKISLSCIGVAHLEADVLTVLKGLDTPPRAVNATFLGYTTVELTPADVDAMGWRVMKGPSA